MLRIAGKVIDPAAPAADPTKPLERVRLVIEKTRFAVLLDGQEALSALRTVENVEMVADILSAAGQADKAMELRKARP